MVCLSVMGTWMGTFTNEKGGHRAVPAFKKSISSLVGE